MTCSHLSTKRAVTGQQDTCLNCHNPIIHDGTKWRWSYDLDPIKRRRLALMYDIDKLTGKHP